MVDYATILLTFIFGGLVGLVVGRTAENVLDRMDIVPMKIRLLLAFLILTVCSVLFELFLEKSGIALMIAFSLGFTLVVTSHELIFPDRGKE